ncbi:hypothetical protein V5799_030972 [Amblyomma americanum]|uniref:Uncharacterized protein n=1 Tax=Amblyomma americanum TaxID=6943 RepID=A0AAQ4ELL8_AMBAM
MRLIAGKFPTPATPAGISVTVFRGPAAKSTRNPVIQASFARAGLSTPQDALRAGSRARHETREEMRTIAPQGCVSVRCALRCGLPGSASIPQRGIHRRRPRRPHPHLAELRKGLLPSHIQRQRPQRVLFPVQVHARPQAAGPKRRRRLANLLPHVLEKSASSPEAGTGLAAVRHGAAAQTSGEPVETGQAGHKLDLVLPIRRGRGSQAQLQNSAQEK